MLTVTVKCFNNMKLTFDFEGDASTVTLRDVMNRINAQEPFFSDSKEVNCIVMNQRCHRDGWERSLAEAGYEGSPIIALVQKVQRSTNGSSSENRNNEGNEGNEDSSENRISQDNESNKGNQESNESSESDESSDDESSEGSEGSEGDSDDEHSDSKATGADQQAPVAKYVKTYGADELKRAMTVNGDIVFNVICDIARANPFYLSYLAINPLLAKSELYRLLNNSTYRLTVVGSDETCDPIKAVNMHPSGDNGYIIDRRNVEFLISNSGVEHNFDKAMEVYLWCDRDIQRTMALLQGPLGVPLRRI